MATLMPDPTFYPSPKVAMQAPKEKEECHTLGSAASRKPLQQNERVTVGAFKFLSALRQPCFAHFMSRSVPYKRVSRQHGPPARITRWPSSLLPGRFPLWVAEFVARFVPHHTSGTE